jgi:hypothetical protein
MAFWLINLAVILKGIEYIRFLQGVSAPILLAVGLLLLAWAYKAAGGFGPMLSASSRFLSFSDFLKFLIPALNGTVGFWATVSLNIPDFTRFAKSQRQQLIGQAARPAHNHDALFPDWNPGDFGDGGDLRHRDLESGAIAEPLSFARGRGDFAAGDSAGDAEREYWRQRGFAS